MIEYWVPTVLGVLLLASGTISGSETAFFSLGRDEVAQQRSRGDFLSITLSNLLARSERLLLTILIANNAVNVAFFALASYWASSNEQLHPAVASIGVLTALVIVGEIIPKVIASERPLALSRVLAPMWILVVKVMRPLSWLVEKCLHPILSERPEDGEFPEVAADELKLVIEQSHRQGVVSSYVHDRLVEVIDLSQIPVYKVMSHRLDCCTIHKSTSYEQALAALRLKPASYVLVIDDEENCVGLLGVQHLLKPGRPSKRMRKPQFLPSGANLAQALELFQSSKATAAVVVDEYGGTDGLLTLAHLTQVLLGDSAADETATVRVEQLSEQRWRLPGSASIHPWKSLLNAPQITNDVATIAGFLAKLSGSIPQQGDRLLYNNLLFIVESTQGLRIETVLVEKLSTGEARRMTQSHIR